MATAFGTHLYSMRERAGIIRDILAKRLDRLIPNVMREGGLDMWVIICNEDNYDPVFNTMMPWEKWAPILQMLVFYDNGSKIERLNVSRTRTGGLFQDIWRVDEPEDQWAWLKRIIEERNPKQIAVNESDIIWGADGLTASLKAKLVKTLGDDLSSRIVSAEPLCIRWLETRLPEELELFQQAARIAHGLIKECLSRTAITPGVTTIEDLRWHYWQRATDHGLPVSFPPFFLRIRSNENIERWGEGDTAIREGDLVHCDVGIEYLRILTDHQEMGYVLRPGETDAPASFREGMRQGNRLQDIFTSSWKEGATGNEILANALRRAHDAGIPNPRIYSHSLSHFLHEPGPLMGLPWEQVRCPGRGDVVMNYDTAYTVELSVSVPAPEWGGQEVRFMLEQDAAITRDGVVYMDGRQTALHLI